MKSLPKIAILDTETLSLENFDGCIWEIAIITGDPYDDGSGYKWTELVWHLKPNMAFADPGALRVNRLYERLASGELPSLDSPVWATYEADRTDHWRTQKSAALEVATSLAGRTVVGAVINFDTERIERWLKNNGQTGAWHYHIVDVEALVAGYLMGFLQNVPDGTCFPGDLIESDVVDVATPDWRSTELLETAGIQTPDGRHDALVDCRWARDAFCKVYGISV